MVLNWFQNGTIIGCIQFWLINIAAKESHECCVETLSSK